MKIRQWKSGNNPGSDCGRMVLITKKEAVQIIRSLSHQLEKLDAGLDPNTVRAEFYPHDDEYGYFSIAVGEYGQVGDNDKVEGDKLCEECIEDDLINEDADDCLCCEDNDCYEECCLLCDQLTEDYTCDDEDEFCEEFGIDTFKPMNVFVRARWLKSQKKT